SWIEQTDVKELHLFLQSHDVSINVATRVYKQYGKDSIKVIRENPYQLAQDVQGIGFRTADDIALKLGLPQDSLPRLATGLKYVLYLSMRVIRRLSNKNCSSVSTLGPSGMLKMVLPVSYVCYKRLPVVCHRPLSSSGTECSLCSKRSAICC